MLAGGSALQTPGRRIQVGPTTRGVQRNVGYLPKPKLNVAPPSRPGAMQAFDDVTARVRRRGYGSNGAGGPGRRYSPATALLLQP